MRHRFAAAAVVLALTLGASSAFAEPTPTELAVARRLFEEAAELEGRSAWPEARAKLNEALAIKETPGLRFHLGYCAEQLGEYVAALLESERALDLIRAGAKAPDVARVLEPAKQRVEAKIAKLTLRLPADATSAEILIDGKKVAASIIGRQAPLDPGKHEVVVRAAGGRSAHLALTLKEGEQRTVDVVLQEPAPAPAAAPERAAPSPQPRARDTEPSAPSPAPAEADSAGGIANRELVLVGEAGVTLIGLGVGIGFMVARGNASERVTSAQEQVDTLAGTSSSGSCASGNSEVRSACDDLEAAINDHERAGLISTIGFVGAGVGAVATVLTYVLWKPESGEQSLVIAPLHAGVGLQAAGSF